MSIERKCENCFYKEFYNDMESWTCRHCNENNKNRFFTPNEKAIRKEERSKIITLLKSDLENFNGLADECVVRKDIHELLENNAVRKYIESTIEILEKEQ